jgi:hypothetical protein
LCPQGDFQAENFILKRKNHNVHPNKFYMFISKMFSLCGFSSWFIKINEENWKKNNWALEKYNKTEGFAIKVKPIMDKKGF